MMFDDLELFNTTRENNRNAFDSLFVKYYPMLCAYARQFVQLSEGEEIVQEVLTGLWENRHTISIDTSFSAYLFAAVRNKCLTEISKNRRQGRIREELFGKMQSRIEEPDYYIARELSEKIREALDRLPESYRIVFEKNRFEGLTYQQIADDLGISPKTVDYRICQSLKILRRELKEYLPLLAAWLTASA